MSRRLIINSDDYGLTPDISRGIREAHRDGVVTSTTCMMNIPSTKRDITIALQETPDLKMGVHLVLTAKKPILARDRVGSLTDKNGDFLKRDPFISNLNHINISEVRAEWHAQIEAFMVVTGTRPTHLDSHHHSSYFSEELFRAMLELAAEYECAIRFPLSNSREEWKETYRHAPELLQKFNPRKPDVFLADFYDQGATLEELLRLIHHLRDGTTELMCYPGHVNEAFAQESTYNFQRERELKVLTAPSIKQAIENEGIELITFADV